MTVIDLAAAERPRVLHVPAYSTSAGDEAIDLAASAGLILDPWQQFVLRNALGERADGRWSAFEVGLSVARQQGKGAVLEARELFGLVLAGEKQIVHTAHELKTSMKHFKRLIKLFEASDDLRRRVRKVINSNGKEGLEMVNGAVLECLARTKNAGRGFTGDLVVLDEAYALTDEQMAASMPTMLAVDNAQVWYTSSPPLDAVSGRVLMKVRDRGESGKAARLAWFDYGLPGNLDEIDEMDLDDRESWQAALPSMRSGRVRDENVQVMRDSLSESDFAREILGIWPKRVEGTGVIDLDLWKSLATTPAESGRPAQLMFAVNVARDRSFTTIAAVGPQDDGRLQCQIVAYKRGTDWVLDRMIELRDAWNPKLWIIEDKGPNASLWAAVLERGGFDEAEDREEPERGDVVAPWANDVVAGYGLFVDALVEKRLAHFRDKPLETAVNGAVTRSLGNGTTWDDKGPVEVSPLKAITNALWGWETLAAKVLDDYDVADSFG
jgi:hypothetical protein